MSENEGPVDDEKVVADRERFRSLVGSPIGDLTIPELAFLARWIDEHEAEAAEICPELGFLLEL